MPRVTFGTVPGTVRGVIRMATCRATRTEILGLLLAPIATVSLHAIPTGTRCPIRKVICLVVGKAISDAISKATPDVIWTMTCAGTPKATSTVTSAATCAAGLGREPARPLLKTGSTHHETWRRVCKPSSVPGKPGDGHLSGHAVARTSQATYPRT